MGSARRGSNPLLTNMVFFGYSCCVFEPDEGLISLAETTHNIAHMELFGEHSKCSNKRYHGLIPSLDLSTTPCSFNLSSRRRSRISQKSHFDEDNYDLLRRGKGTGEDPN